jgi:hypothetical protein
MSLETQLAAATTREQYVAVLKITLTEVATALCRLAKDEGLPTPYCVTFTDQSRCHSRVAELLINDTLAWTKEPEAVHLSLPISGKLTGADGRTVTLSTLE